MKYTKGFEVVLTRELEVLAILMGGGAGAGGAKRFHPLKKRGGGERCKRFYSVLKSFGPAIFPFCSALPLPVINDQYLRLLYKNDTH